MPLGVDQFVARLRASDLIEQAELNAFLSARPENQPADVQTLVRDLIQAGKLTKHQAAAVYQGRARDLVLGNYVIVDKLGEGGMGEVYRARHKVMQREVALKVLPAKLVGSPDAVRRFHREVRAAAKLEHPNIVTAYDADQDAGRHFLVMQFVAGRDLSNVIKLQGPMTVQQALDCCIQTARGLAYAHNKGVIHRDIKPSNLLLENGGTIKILDMGLARLAEAGQESSAGGLTQTGQIMGTVDYMAPEQAENTREADHRADIYSLGCTLYVLLTTRPPFPGGTMVQKMMAHQKQPPPKPSEKRGDAPPILDAVLARMMAKLPDERYQSMDDVIAALESCRAPADANAAAALATESSDSDLTAFLDKLSAGEGKGIATRVATAAAKHEATLKKPASQLIKPGSRLASNRRKKSSLGPALVAVAAVAASLVLLFLWRPWAATTGRETVVMPDTGKSRNENSGSPSRTQQSPVPKTTSTPATSKVVESAPRAQAQTATFTAPENSQGIEPVIVKEGGRAVEQKSIAGRPALVTSGNRLYFRVNNAFAYDLPPDTSERLRLHLTVLDNEEKNWQVIYDAHEPNSAAFKYGREVRLNLPGKKQWVDIEFELTNARLAGRDQFGADFFIQVSRPSAQIAVHSARLSRIPPESVSPAWTASFTAATSTHGIMPVGTGNRATKVVEVQGKPAIQLGDPQGKDMHFALDDAIAFDLPEKSKDRIVVRATVFDEQPGSYSISYDSHQPTGGSVSHVLEPYPRLSGSGKWVNIEWELPHPRLANRMHANADFALVVYSRPVHQVTLSRRGEKTTGPISTAASKLFNGVDLTGWRGDRSGWKVAEGQIVGNRGGIRLVNDPVPLDFELTFDVRGQGDSFLVVRDKKSDAGRIILGINRPGNIWQEKTGWKQVAKPSNAGLLATKTDDFNAVEVRVVGQRIRVTVNGVVAVDGEFPLAAEGPLMWMMGSDAKELRIRNVRLLDLSVPASFTNPFGMEFVRVPAGKSWLGGGGGKAGTREVHFKDDFYFGKFEVTQGQWEAIMDFSRPSYFLPGAPGGDAVKGMTDAQRKQLPVENVAWDQTQEFLRRLNLKANETGWVYRLPTADEWEYACRGGPLAKPEDSGFDFYFNQPSTTITAKQANVKETELRRTCEIGSYAANRLGLFDMHGNVREWCSTEVILPDGKPRRSTRSGGWATSAGDCRASRDHGEPPTSRHYDLGLRVARVPAAGSWQPLFRDKALSGWKVGDTGGAEVVAEAGAPTLKLTEPVTVTSPTDVGDYHLRFEYKPSPGQYGGGVHLALRESRRLTLGLGDLKRTQMAGSGVTFFPAEIRNKQIVRSGEQVLENQPSLLPNVTIDPARPWQRFEVYRRGDSFIIRINGQTAGLYTSVRFLRDGKEELLESQQRIVFWAFGGPGLFRNVEIREINTLPADILE